MILYDLFLIFSISIYFNFCLQILKPVLSIHIPGFASLIINQQFIYTAGAHLSDDNFKLWSASMVSRGSTLFIAPHGGAIPQKYIDFGLHERFPDRLTWWLDISHNFRRVFPSILVRKIKPKKYQNHQKSYLLVLKALHLYSDLNLLVKVALPMIYSITRFPSIKLYQIVYRALSC